MSLTYTWNISQLDTATEGSLDGVVKNVHWRYVVTDGEHSADIYGSFTPDPPESNTFISYDQLTQNNIIAWLESKLEVDEMKLSLDHRLEKVINPPQSRPGLPWV